jgi:hypothetical protein
MPVTVQKCIVCNYPQAKRQEGVGDFARFDCARCGVFVLTDTAAAVLERLLAEEPLRRSLMSHALRRMQRPDGEHLHKITNDELPSYWKNERLPTPLEQADNLILWIGDHQQAPGTWVDGNPSAIAATIGMTVSADGNDSGAWSWLNKQLEPKKLYQLHPTPPGGTVRVMLEMAGWERYEALKKQRIESRTAFMALKFGQPELDEMVEECFRPAVKRTGFELRILTDQQRAGLIDNQIRAAILSARFMISDLTHGSYGAYWEAGFGEGRGIPVIYTCESAAWAKTKTHFDTNHMATIIWDVTEKKKAEDALVAMIRATLRTEANQTDD